MMHHLSFSQLFSVLTLAFCGLFAAATLFAWTGPTAAAPNGNVSAPINVGTTDQVKDGGISVNSLAVFGSSYIQNKLGVGVVSPVVSIETPGTIKIGSGGEVCQAVTEGGIRYNSSSRIMEYCDGTDWCPMTGCSTSGSQTYATPGTFTFSVPSYTTLTVEAWGAGGSGGTSGMAGGASSFNGTVTAGGGGAGQQNSAAAGGVASGGDTNESGGAGQQGKDGASGGASPHGGAGGTSTGQGSHVGKDGGAPGGGGGGGDGGCGTEAGSGGGGAYAKKTYSAGQLSSSVTVVVGVGGVDNSCTGGWGGAGEVSISWE